jgi:hypothetical protein
MKPVCEVMVQNIFPALRASIAKELMTEYKLNQSETAKLLGVSQPAISQYIRQLRGENKRLVENKIVSDEVKKICKKISAGGMKSSDLMNEFCHICKIMTSKKLVCEMHRKIYNVDGCTSCCS